MAASNVPSSYRDLIRQTQPPEKPARPTPEEELDSLLGTYHGRAAEIEEERRPRGDVIKVLRERTINEFIPAFIELVEKYSSRGISMHMDASSFLEGGRELRFEFALTGFRMELLGTVTTEAIAFHETRRSPQLQGGLTSGSMLRLRGLTAAVFREFICQRLTLLVRTAMPRSR